MLILTASRVPPATDLPAGYRLRRMAVTDIPALGALYFAAYDPGDAAASVEEALGDIEASFAGDYGELWLAASPVITVADEVVAASMVVRQASWPGAPPGPFVIEVFTDRAHRRRGLGRAMLSAAMRVALAEGEGSIGLQVNRDNAGARSLYRELGFSEPAMSVAGADQNQER